MSIKCKHAVLVVILLVWGTTVAHAGMQKWDAKVRAANPIHWYKFNEAVGTTEAVDMGRSALSGTYRSLVDLGQEGLFGPGEAVLFERGGQNDVMWTQGGDLTSVEWTAEYIVKKVSNTVAQALSDSADFSVRIVGWGVNEELSFTEYGVIDARFTAVGGASLVAPVDEWMHVAYRKTASGTEVFLNGVLTGTTTTTMDCPIDSFGGRAGGASDGMDGFMDEVAIYDYALTDEEILAHAQAPFVPDVGAVVVQPQTGAKDVRYDTDLVWIPGIYVVTHDVYFGEVFADVNNADRSNPLDVLVSQDQDDSVFAPADPLQFGQTYYWRVDEVNGAPDRTVFTGDVWSFIVEPKGIPITSITATASSAAPDMGPEKTIDGSGLNALDQHSNNPTDMWLSTPPDGGAIWIQYEFDQPYKLHEMLVWNSNQIIEPFLGFGIKDAVVETSIDGANWTPISDSKEFARATGKVDYTANTAVDFAGVMSQFVRITVTSSYGGPALGKGLAEVRFLAIPVAAREPQPADGATTDSATVALAWRSGREAVSHEVSLGTDAANLSLIDTTSAAQAVTDPLDYGTTYFWSVTEVNDAAVPAANAGPVWSFITPASGVVDDFESYSGDEGQEVFMTWLDGYGGDASLGGSITGHIDGPFVETAIVYGGGQSLPVYIDNDGGFVDIDGKSSSPTFSEVLREFATPQDWTISGVKTLSIMFRGSTGLTGQLYCKIGNTKLLYDGDAANIGISAWQAWNIDLSTVGGNLKSVRELAIGVEGGSSGLLYIDEIRLYPQVGEMITPTEPDNTNLAGLWNFDEGTGLVAQDSSGNGNNGTFASAQWVPGKVGTALEFTRADQVDCGDVLTLTEGLTIACWVNPTELLGEKSFVARHGAYILKASGNFLRFTTPGVYDYTGTNTLLEAGVWQHVAVTFVPNQADGLAFYLNGVETERLNHTGGTTSGLAAGTGPFQIGNSPWDEFYLGMIDEVHVYDQPLLPGEILWLSGSTQAMHKPF